MSICQEKDDMVSVLQTTLDQNVEAATKDVNVFYTSLYFKSLLKKKIYIYISKEKNLTDP